MRLAQRVHPEPVLDFARTDLAVTIREVTGFLHGDIVARNVRVVLDLPPDLRCTGSSGQLQQVVRNAEGPVLFGFNWGAKAGHMMTGYRDFRGTVRFADQLGRTISRHDRTRPFCGPPPPVMWRASRQTVN